MSLKYQKNVSGDFICSHCDYTARIQSTMHYHLKKHEGALPHSCKHCNQKFLQKGLLELHISARHQETLTEKKEKFQCPCDTCKYEDIRKGNCLIHFVRVHYKELTEAIKRKSKVEGMCAECDSCKKTFKSMTQFYYHASSCIKPPENTILYTQWRSLL